MIFRSFFLCIIAYFRAFFHKKKKMLPDTIGFLHPYPDAMGGGELVLWTWISKLPKDQSVIIYCTSTQKDLLDKAKDRFNIDLREDIKFVLINRDYFKDSNYKYLTLLGQAFGSIIFASDCCSQDFLPSKFIDTTGLAFGYPILKFYGIPVTAYVHYPIISTDMISKVKTRKSAFNNSQLIAKYPILSIFKLWYYQIYAIWYSNVGNVPKKVYVNSTWTKNHIDELWQISSEIKYPPCQSTDLLRIPLERNSYEIVSVAQFRPEKNHKLQIQAFAKVIRKAKRNHLIYFPHLTLVGGSRNKEDEKRIEELKSLTQTLEIEKYVTFMVNAPYSDLKKCLEKSDIGLHTMIQEHFGIGIIEYMFSGCIAVAHNSGGPKLDIVKNGLGYLATTTEEYAQIIYTVLYETSTNVKLEMREKARASVVERFSKFDI
eukprot:NODE_148_length_15570_cov_0.950100.p7 type:complete len:430 gc:universal NODE_148_length_15570_cov_0.950100:5705-4416(-)